MPLDVNLCIVVLNFNRLEYFDIIFKYLYQTDNSNQQVGKLHSICLTKFQENKEEFLSQLRLGSLQ